jgi:hypothetical protein
MNIPVSIWWIIVALMILLILLITITIVRAVHQGGRQSDIEKYIAETFDDWFAHLYHGYGAPLHESHRKHQKFAIEKIFSTFLNNAYSPEIKRRISEYANDNFSSTYKHDLCSPLWAKRVNALNKIAEFKVPGFMDIFDDRRISRMTRFEFFLFLIYLSHFDMNEFKAKFFYKDDLTEYEYKKIFMRLDDDRVSNIESLYAVMRKPAKYAYIERVSRMTEDTTVKWLESLFDDEDSEVRIRVLKAVLTLRHVDKASKYVGFFQSDVWEERMLVSRMAPYIGIMSVKGLKDCAGDRHPLVQDAAVESLKYFNYEEVGWSVDYEKGASVGQRSVI